MIESSKICQLGDGRKEQRLWKSVETIRQPMFDVYAPDPRRRIPMA